MDSNRQPLLKAHYFGIFGDGWQDKMKNDFYYEEMDILILCFTHTYEVDGKSVLGYEEAHSKDSGTEPSDKERIEQICDLAHARNPKIKVMMSHGWGTDHSRAATTTQSFADSVAQFLQSIPALDGFAFDYEIEDDPITQEQFETLILAVRNAIPKEKLFGIAVDKTSLRAWNGQLVDQVFDYVFAMTYWGNRWDYVEWFLSSGVSAQKFLVGISTEDSETPEKCMEYVILYRLPGVFAWRADTDNNCKGVHAIYEACGPSLQLQTLTQNINSYYCNIV